MHRLLEGAEPSLIILDLRLGQDDGLDLLREIRSHSDVPVIITTGHRPDEIDRIVGLELGADDYIIKPFSLRELLARVRAVLRRSGDGTGRPRARSRARRLPLQWLEAGTSRSQNCSIRVDAPVALSKGEYALLLAFLEAPQRPLTREHLLQATRVHEDIFRPEHRRSGVALRRKLETLSQARRASFRPGVGEAFAVPVEPVLRHVVSVCAGLSGIIAANAIVTVFTGDGDGGRNSGTFRVSPANIVQEITDVDEYSSPNAKRVVRQCRVRSASAKAAGSREPRIHHLYPARDME